MLSGSGRYCSGGGAYQNRSSVRLRTECNRRCVARCTTSARAVQACFPPQVVRAIDLCGWHTQTKTQFHVVLDLLTKPQRLANCPQLDR